VTVIYCDNSECTFHCEGECQRTSIVLESDCSYSGVYCASVEKRKAPVSMPAEQEPMKINLQVNSNTEK
jgi:hypothetical protein